MRAQILSPVAIAEVCFGANQGYLEATTRATASPTWAELPASVKTELTARVGITLEGLRASSGRGSATTMHASGDTEAGPGTYGNPIQDAIFTNIVTACYENGNGM